uniref:Protein asunder n=1 Tax=Bursaphelenchus xylophilus TaxID=6326 RepID=A0A1I7RMA1_BURXY
MHWTKVEEILTRKEESNATKSTNYNVEMFHANQPHSYLRQLHLLDADSPITNVENEYSSTSLKWSSVNNRMVANDAPLYENGAAVTVAKVRDRPAICICNFILNGKFVLLDMDPDSKVSELSPNFHNLKISHFFSLDHTTGAMFLNGMRFDPSAFPPLPDPINDRLLLYPLVKLIEFMRLQLDIIKYPLKATEKKAIFDQTMELAKNFGQYLPIHDSDSVFYQSAEFFRPLLDVINSNTVTPEMIAEAKSFVYRAVGDNLSTLPYPQSTLITLNMTQEERVKVTFVEVARILKNYSAISPEHTEFYNFFLGITGLDLNEEFSKQQARPDSPTVHRRSRSNSPVPTKRSKKLERDALTLHELFAAKAEVCWRGWKDFEGRINANSAQAKLYPNLKTVDSEPIGGVRPSDRRRNNVMEQ